MVVIHFTSNGKPRKASVILRNGAKFISRLRTAGVVITSVKVSK